MKLKKGEFKYILLMILMIIVFLGAVIYVFNRDAKKCDLEKGYQCDASQVFQYNK